MKQNRFSRQAFLRYWNPVIEVLKNLGGSGKPSEVTDLVIEKLNIPEEEVEISLKSGASRVRNNIAWARAYLVKAGILDSSKRGVWSLTEKGFSVNLSEEDIYHIFKEIQASSTVAKKHKQKDQNDTEHKDDDSEDNEDIIEFVSYKTELLNILQSLPPDGFERMCQRLLRESGFEQVKVTGKTGDGGIDGHGIFQENIFVSSRVLFQCKRYKGSVSSPQVRDFRGSMIGRADKGIIITTGYFTKNAKEEALRVLPLIEMIDGEKLIRLFENLEIGLKPKIDYDIDYDFFEDFKS